MESSVVIFDEGDVREAELTLGLGDEALDSVLGHVVMLLVMGPQCTKARVALVTKLAGVPG